MSLNLDTRQRAMLDEMGVHVWWPAALPADLGEAQVAMDNEADSAYMESARGQNDIKIPSAAVIPPSLPADNVSAAPVASPVQLATPTPPQVGPSPSHHSGPQTTARAPSPTQVTTLPDGIARMDWPQIQGTLADCQACAMCLGRRASVLAAPDVPTPCDWLVVGDPPDEAQERLGLPFVEDAGLLLDNMLRAVGVQRWAPWAAPAALAAEPSGRAYLTHVLKCRPALMRAPSADELATCAHYLRREIALTQPKVILAMGRFAMQTLLSDTPPESAKLPLGKLRGQVWQFAGVPLVVTYPPSYLLRNPQDKGKAWADLCLALDAVQGRLS
ncbi:hypothetical protein MIZ03_3873 [Rhodoferax lithotrophicus]|uniref:Uracil-DNA glycosylase-like domain-containing protein n=1 Tax=Rhodoferax lithotrophicus TaxID=2798804 RepID=A0ABN6DBE6_9BURK|nr:uracil-DNA glycosylase [Rhodoferax sp. MIZ03]BCO28963.1 hypothetical protein MIZ03_3873 [Rhodoferax sp. MIZ03]